ncbi:WG repeat-containing protein [Leptospira interrogans]|uniref:WG repeat-containing protein n=1 Tax=Leptospira interrogans TaxID=173 RepID=UPI001CE2924E|nr:WG repeat-containing protein [Leptospira interrogans]
MRYLSTLVVMFCLLQCRPDDPRIQGIAGPDLLPGAYQVLLSNVGQKELNSISSRKEHQFSEDKLSINFNLIEAPAYSSGYIDKTGNVVIEPKFRNTPVRYRSYKKFNSGVAVVQNVGDEGYKEYCLQRMKTGLGKKFDPSLISWYQCEERVYDFIDGTGKIASSIPAFSFNSFVEGWAATSVAKNGKYGYTNRSNKTAIPEIYDDAGDFNSGIALVELNGDRFFINTKGKKVFGKPFESGRSFNFSDGMSVVQKDARIKLVYGEKFWEGGLYGYMNTTGKVVIEPRFSRADFFSEGFAYVETPSGEKGYIDKTGNFKIQFKDLETSRSFSDGLAYVEFHDDNFDKIIGFINKTGKLVLNLNKDFISSSYDEVGDFSEGLAIVYTKDPNRRMLFIDKTGKVAFDVNDINRKIWERFKKY